LAYLGIAKLDEAKILFKQALDANPDTVDAVLGMARIAAIERRPAETQSLIERALRIDPRSLDGMLMMAELQWALGSLDGARIAYRKVLDVYPANPKAHIGLAWLAIRAGQSKAATAHAEVARKGAPNSPQANYLNAFLESRQKNFTAAKVSVARALRSAPRDIPSLLLAGALAYTDKDYRRAQQLLLTGLVRLPTHVGGRKLYAATLLKLGQPSSALGVLLPTLKIAAEDHELLTLIGKTYIQSGDHVSAAEYLEKAVRLRPDDVKTRVTLGVTQIASGQLGPALSAIESGLGMDASNPELDSLLVLIHLKRGNIALAEKSWDALRRKRPNDPETFYLHGSILAAKNDIAGARKALEEAVMIDPEYAPATMGLARLDLNEGDPINARRRLERLVRTNPRKIDALVALAELGPSLKASESEIREWLVAARIVDADALKPAVMLARLHLRAGDAKQALAVAREAQRKHPEQPEVLDVLAAAQVVTRDLAGALGTYTQLAFLLPRSADVLFRLAQAQIANGSDVTATLTLKKVLELRPDHIGSLSALARVHIRAGRHQDALDIARQLQTKHPKSATGYGIEGEVMLATGKFAVAALAFESAQRIAPTTRQLFGLHAALENSGHVELADARLQQWIENQPADFNARRYLADVLVRRGALAQAKAQYMELAKRGPEHAIVLNNLAWLMHRTGEAGARAYAERALKLDPDNAVVLDTLGAIVAAEGEVARSIELLQRAVSRAPARFEPRMHLAQAWLKSGNYARARAELEQLLNNASLPDQIAEAKKMLETLPY
jgi:putative PEP-CTERM system TPR-repeat lipoprotein